MYSYISLLYHLLWQLCRMYWPVSWYFDRGMINFNRSLLSATTAACSTAHFFFTNVVGVYIPEIRHSLNGDTHSLWAGGSFCKEYSVLKISRCTFPCFSKVMWGCAPLHMRCNFRRHGNLVWKEYSMNRNHITWIWIL